MSEPDGPPVGASPARQAPACSPRRGRVGFEATRQLSLFPPPTRAPATLAETIGARLAQLWAALASRRPTLGPAPPVSFDLRGRSAGQYSWEWRRGGPQGERLRFNLHLAAEQPERFLEETVAHEAAHCVALRLHRHAGHGAPWRAVMGELGVEASRCHLYDTRRAQGRGHWPARCPCREHDLSSVLRNRLRKGARYRCRLCGGPIRLLAPSGDGDE